MNYKNTNRKGFLIGLIDLFTAGLFLLFYMPRGLQDELDEMLSAEGIDITNITEEDIEILGTEATGVALQALGVLMQNVPGIATLLNSMQ